MRRWSDAPDNAAGSSRAGRNETPRTWPGGFGVISRVFSKKNPKPQNPKKVQFRSLKAATGVERGGESPGGTHRGLRWVTGGLRQSRPSGRTASPSLGPPRGSSLGQETLPSRRPALQTSRRLNKALEENQSGGKAAERAARTSPASATN